MKLTDIFSTMRYQYRNTNKHTRDQPAASSQQHAAKQKQQAAGAASLEVSRRVRVLSLESGRPDRARW